MNFLQDGFNGYLVLFVAGVLATEAWRWIGLAVGTRLDVGGAPFHWVRAVATALIAGMVMRMVLFPAGGLTAIPLTLRLGAFTGGLAIYFATRRNLGAGVAGGAILLIAVQMLLR